MSDANPQRPVLLADFIRFHAALTPAEIGTGFLGGWITPAELVVLAWMRSADLGHTHQTLCDLAHAPAGAHDEIRTLCQELAVSNPDPEVWRYLAAVYLLDNPAPSDDARAIFGALFPEHRTAGGASGDIAELARHAREAGRQRFLLDRAAAGDGMKMGRHVRVDGHRPARGSRRRVRPR